jgi:RsiW-degrading membrane proteinase PrsW (M82 family)
VLNVYLLGVLLMAAFSEPVLQQFFTIDRWLYDQWWTRLLGGSLIVGCFEQFLVYVAVRYSVFSQPEFDERMDGMIYAVAAGLGLATVLNFRYVLKHGGVDLDIGSIRIVIHALALASFAGVQGYFIGQTRFERTPVYYLPSGLLLAAGLHGLFFYLLEQAAGNRLATNPWRDLIWAAVVAVSTLAILFWLMARANEETLRVAQQVQATSSVASPITPGENG